MLLEGKNALITGATQGIGKSIALTLAREGANIAVCDIKEEHAQQVLKEIRDMGRKCEFYPVNVSDASQVKDVVDKALDNFSRIDILVNNAGITRDN
ncbi:MAG: SDR family NAD(P)-dependent oxidoreductase, partial [Chlamydiota bacterium]|nr:SDR family NAD(P)-dependent oxidoreductase [Chlamydiota bacterium]